MDAHPDSARRILARPETGRTIRITQHNDLRFTSLVIDEASLALVRCGTMHVQSPQGEWFVREGEALAVAGGLTVSMTNLPGKDGFYQGQWLTWHDALVQESAHGQGASSLVDARLLTSLPEAFIEAFERACGAVESGDALPDGIAAHRLSEVLLWLAMQEIYFDTKGLRSLSRRIRILLRTALSRNWSEAEVGRQVGMSPATLRRYLAAEGTSFRVVLADTRMQAALHLLQSTALSISQVALEVGYESQSRFAARFRSRFGFQPSHVRGHKRR